jgi:hypothetical protein
LSDYDQFTIEDEKQNRMFESLELFELITSIEYIPKNIPIILFLNKSDIFSEKIKMTNLKVCFEDYHGNNYFLIWLGDLGDEKKAIEFIKKKFYDRCKKKKIFIKITCATDTSMMQSIFDSIKHIFLEKILKDSGYL